MQVSLLLFILLSHFCLPSIYPLLCLCLPCWLRLPYCRAPSFLSYPLINIHIISHFDPLLQDIAGLSPIYRPLIDLFTKDLPPSYIHVNHVYLVYPYSKQRYCRSPSLHLSSYHTLVYKAFTPSYACVDHVYPFTNIIIIAGLILSYLLSSHMLISVYQAFTSFLYLCLPCQPVY